MTSERPSITVTGAHGAGAGRFDLYRLFHKGLRAFMSDTLLAVGRLDVEDGDERWETLRQVRELLALCRTHLEHKHAYIHRALEARRPGCTSLAATGHADQESAIARLEQCAREVESRAGAGRLAAARELYRQLALFVADHYAHMDHEETQLNEQLWATHSDAELRALHATIMTRTGPAERALALRWMLPNTNTAERAAVLADLRAGTSPQVFNGVLVKLRERIGALAWQRLARALDLPHGAGLAFQQAA
jgi:hypothetical protein